MLTSGSIPSSWTSGEAPFPPSSHASASGVADDEPSWCSCLWTHDELALTSRRRLLTMPDTQSKRSPAVSGAGTAQSSCTRFTNHNIHKLTALLSKGPATHRRNDNSSRHRERIGSRLSTTQILFESHRCVQETLRSASPPNLTAILLTPHPRQQSKDVEDKLRDLIPWLTKLENTVTTGSLDTNPEGGPSIHEFVYLRI